MKTILCVLLVLVLYIGSISNISADEVPDWVKNTAGWWASDAISEKEFVNAIEFLVKDGIINVSTHTVSENSNEVPDWVKNTAGWWASDAISEKEFVNAIEFLVKDGIISIENKIQHAILDTSNYVSLTELSYNDPQLKNSLYNYALEWHSGNITDEVFLDKVQNHESYTDIIQYEQKNDELPDWLTNNASRFAAIILTGTEPEKFNLNYVDESLFPCNHEYIVNENYPKPELERNPNYDCWDIEINSEGFRHSEFSQKKSDDIYRIIAVGGSTTFGGESNNLTWPGHLQRIFNEKIPEMKIEVINAGLNGANTKSEIQMIKNKLLPLDPNLIIMYDGWNDSTTIEIDDTIKNWKEVCELGDEYGFETSIIVQPLPTSSKRILAHQEISNVLRPSASSPTDYREISQMYVDSFVELNKTCSHTDDLREIFDYIPQPIFYDGGHVTNQGNKIVALNIFSSIASEYFQKAYSIKYHISPGDSKFSDISLFAVGVNLQNKTMNDLNLSGAIFDNSILKNSDFSNSNLTDSRFVFSNLSGANLSHVDLSNANLSGANLEGANLSGANLEGANLSGANLSHVDLSNTNLSNSIMHGTKLLKTNLSGHVFGDLDFGLHTTFYRLNLSHADLSYTDLSHLDFSYYNLSHVDLSGRDLSNTILSDANLSYANLSDANLSYANLSNANLSYANLSNVNFTNAFCESYSHMCWVP